MRYLPFAAAAFVVSAVAAHAVPILNASTGLVDPEFEIGFDEVNLADGAPVTDQFAAFGATFTGLQYDDGVGFTPRANTGGALLFDFSFQQGDEVMASILFNSSVSAATFALGSNNGMATFTSYLDGIEVESFTASIARTAARPNDPDRQDNVFGFEDSVFDEIRFMTSGSTGASFDSLAFNAAPPVVPLPASLPLLLAGLGGLAVLRRRKS